MPTVGQIERKTQQRGKLFREKLGYAYLGDWEEREVNRNIESEQLSALKGTDNQIVDACF